MLFDRFAETLPLSPYSAHPYLGCLKTHVHTCKFLEEEG